MVCVALVSMQQFFIKKNCQCYSHAVQVAILLRTLLGCSRQELGYLHVATSIYCC